MDGSFPREYIPTDNYTLRADTSFGVVNLDLWDIVSPRSYGFERALSYRMTSVFVLCYSVSDPKSCEYARTYWVRELTHYAPKVPIILVACKIDVREREGQEGDNCISTAEGQEVAEDIGVRTFLECSAMTGEGVQRVVDTAAEIGMRSKTRTAKASAGCVTF